MNPFPPIDITEKHTSEAIELLEKAKILLEVSGHFEQLQCIGAWSPRHHTEKLERQLNQALYIALRFAQEIKQENHLDPSSDCPCSICVNGRKLAALYKDIYPNGNLPECIAPAPTPEDDDSYKGDWQFKNIGGQSVALEKASLENLPPLELPKSFHHA